MDRRPERVVTQEWEGYVLSIDTAAGKFIAFIFDITDPSAEEEEAEFSIDSVSKEDLNRLVPGALFYWRISVIETNESQIKRSKIVFQ